MRAQARYRKEVALGADLCLLVIKKPDREKTLAAIDQLDDKQLGWVAETAWGDARGYDPDEIREWLRGAVEEVLADRRDVAEVRIDEPGTYLVTGGMTWGDDPTDAFKYFVGLINAGLGGADE